MWSKKKKIKLLAILFIFSFVFVVVSVMAASPTGNDNFELTASPFTGGDNTGDGGTGAMSDLNYYYVGQNFTANMRITAGSASGSNGADLWIDYSTTNITASSLTTGSFYGNWTGQSISGGRIKSSAYNNPGNYSSGSGGFGTVNFEMIRPTAAAYGTGAPETLDINVGVIGATTESNISYDGSDILDDEEDFQLHIWADTIKPYALNPLPADTVTGVAVEDNYVFDLRDSKNGEGDDVGVGTGVNTATTPGILTFNDGGGSIDYTSYDAYACSGVWGNNLCITTINPPSPLGIAGDSRNWKYSTTYTVDISGYQDRASAAQDQLGDTNGPNIMDAKSWTFSTEPDTVRPRVTSETPTRGSVGATIDTNVTVEVTDRKTYPGGPSGTGLNSSTCDITVSSATFPSTTFEEGDAGVTVTAINYGYRYVIDPASDFGQNEVVSVSVFNCQDVAVTPNTMTTDNYTFTTSDTDEPYVDTLSPDDNTVINVDGTISFHLKDDGVGVVLSDTVVYVNGVYYTDGGGAGSVTTNGTKITYASSLDFNGGNYVGDTTSLAGTTADFTFIIDPEVSFAAGEVVPYIVYARDISNNLMERKVVGLVATGASCGGGDIYCGADTTWSGALCEGTGGGACPSSGGGGGSGGGSIIATISNQTVTQIDEQSVIVSWFSNLKGDSRVVYSETSPDEYGKAPMYGYTNSVEDLNDEITYHAMIIDGLEVGKVYYFRPVSKTSRGYARGEELMMSPMYKDVEIRECESDFMVIEEIINDDKTFEEQVIAEVINDGSNRIIETKAGWVKIYKITQVKNVFRFMGKATPGSRIRVTITPKNK